MLEDNLTIRVIKKTTITIFDMGQLFLEYIQTENNEINYSYIAVDVSVYHDFAAI